MIAAESLQRLFDRGAVDVRIMRDARTREFRVLVFGPDSGFATWCEQAAGLTAADALRRAVALVDAMQAPNGHGPRRDSPL